MIARILRHYLSRFRWEIAAFWLVSAGNSLVLATNGSPRLMAFLSMTEIVALVWVTIRVVLAEDGFKMSGGWRTRPLAPLAQHLVPLGLAVAVVLLPSALRAMVLQRLFGGGIWQEQIRNAWLPQWFTWLAFAGALKVFGMVILRGVDGRARTAAWSTLAVILLPLTVMVCGRFRDIRTNHGTGGSGDEPNALAEGIQRQLPDATDFIGEWNNPVRLPDVSEAKLIAKFQLDTHSASQDINLRSARSFVHGVRVGVQVRVLVIDARLASSLERAIPVLRYADGTYATCTHHRRTHNDVSTPLLSAREWQFSGDFISPLSLPEFDGQPEDLLRGLELLFFVEDLDKPTFEPSPLRMARNSNDQAPAAKPFSPAGVQELFERFPWSDETWKRTARPFLIRHATQADIPFLLEKLEFDTRLMSVFAEKGWKAEAMPVLRKLAKERIPMEVDCIELLAREQDPSLSADLMAIALQHRFNLDRIEAALRTQPGFDWPAFAREAWRRTKYATHWTSPYGEFWITALWAAKEGDFTAFRHTAEEAARGKKWEMEQLAGLVAGEHQDLLAFLRENMDAMTFDPVTRKWRLR